MAKNGRYSGRSSGLRDIGVDLHAKRAEFVDRALRLADAGVARRKRDLRHEAREMILVLRDDLGQPVIDQAAEFVDLRGRLGDQLNRRLRVAEDLLIVLVAVDDPLAHVEVVKRRQRAHALAHVPIIGCHVVELVEESLREKMRVGVNAHGRFSSAGHASIGNQRRLECAPFGRGVVARETARSTWCRPPVRFPLVRSLRA